MAGRGLVVIALGGNAIAPAGTPGTATEQRENIGLAMRPVASLVEEGWQVVLTHGNGPQVGNLLVKNELARDVVPPMPLDWCVAQTQATVGHTIANTLEVHLERHAREHMVVPLTSRVLVDGADPAMSNPSKPIGRWLTDRATVRRLESEGQRFVHDDERGWRRVVPSPEPRQSLELDAIRALLDIGAVVVANGGGGVPTIRTDDGQLVGVEAVIDKDLAGAVLARELGAAVYVILTDVPGVAIRYGHDDERWLTAVTPRELRRHQQAGEFRAGSMAPKVEAVCRFVDSTGGRAAIASLDHAAGAVHGDVGTQVTAVTARQAAV
ncbi:MAG: carbamate kinase [Nitriliruptorales bacterium]|nr:carbamate kinase [Nitriliruptorales bacterium]